MTAREDLAAILIASTNRQADETGGACWNETAEAAIAAGWRPPVQVVTDLAGMQALPVGAVVRSAAGTFARRVSAQHGVKFGEGRPFVWPILGLPVEVHWLPEVAS